MKKIIISIICLNLYFGFSQQTPSKDQNKTIAIVGGTTHVGNGNTIENKCWSARQPGDSELTAFTKQPGSGSDETALGAGNTA